MNPEPTDGPDCSTDYMVHDCPGVCYSTDAEGFCVTKCEGLIVGLDGMKCARKV